RSWKTLFEETLLPKGMKQLGKPSPVAASLGLLAIVCFCGILVLLPDSLRLRSKTYSMVDNAISKFYEQWKEQKVREIDFDDNDATLGDPNSKIRIVEFSDFQCPFCRKAAFTLHNALDPIKDRIFFVFKHFPLDQACNGAVTFR